MDVSSYPTGTFTPTKQPGVSHLPLQIAVFQG